ncbi:oxidoreductase [Novosphingobium sp. AAP1]|uniref:FAD-dependent monooxygenase n=1 Tax=Novosphingobium sp. AAP1 TaxID=1523413 RepID=UPI0006B9D26C|nr:FAD-dependent monooxygenase [Novosphingobium sp. AAP1]KPF56367.1 oxidoreductase [Novosphingobium sp. AAP1]
MPKQLKTLVVGGGVGGMATAIAFAQHGIVVDLVDIDPQWKVLGAGITITGPTLRAFKALDLLDEVSTAAAFSKKVGLYTQAGDLIAEHAMPPLAADLPAAGGILRPVLHNIMSSRTRAVNTDVRLGVTVASFTQDADGVDVVFTDGSNGRYDLVVGADGAFSAMRGLLFPDAPRPQFTGQGCWRVLADRPAWLDSGRMYYGPDRKAGVTPCSADKMYMFCNTPMPGNPRVGAEEGIAMLREILAGFGGVIATVRDDLGPDSAFNYRPLEAMLLPRPWAVGRVGLIGDAAHATTPHLASGAGLAVEDGLVLAHEMLAADSVAAGWHAFAERRWERSRLVVQTSVRLGQMEIDRAPSAEQTQVFGVAVAALAEPI